MIGKSYQVPPNKESKYSHNICTSWIQNKSNLKDSKLILSSCYHCNP